jgi:cation transport protein ChaC
MTTLGAHDLWVFAYGSLMWRPAFAYAEARRARLTGYHRAFCIYSVHHRGTPRRRGRVLGLDRGGVCEGVAYRIAAADAAPRAPRLRAREQVSGVYREALVPVEIEQRHPPVEVTALAYIVERAHPAYAGRLPLGMQARVIRGARGLSGANLDYLVSTVRHLQELGIRERDLERLVVMAGPLAGARTAQHTSPAATALLRRADLPRLRCAYRLQTEHAFSGCASTHEVPVPRTLVHSVIVVMVGTLAGALYVLIEHNLLPFSVKSALARVGLAPHALHGIAVAYLWIFTFGGLIACAIFLLKARFLIALSYLVCSRVRSYAGLVVS